MANFYLLSYIQEALKKASYEYGKATKQWCGWLNDFPGIYAQAKTLEEARDELAEMLESYMLLKLREGEHLPGFRPPIKTHRAYAKPR